MNSNNVCSIEWYIEKKQRFDYVTVPIDIKILERLQSEIGKSNWYEYIIKYIKRVKEQAIEINWISLWKNKLPYQLDFHLSKLKQDEIKLVINKINEILKPNLILFEIKIHLWFIRDQCLAILETK
jgi:hypothetical protein